MFPEEPKRGVLPPAREAFPQQPQCGVPSEDPCEWHPRCLGKAARYPPQLSLRQGAYGGRCHSEAIAMLDFVRSQPLAVKNDSGRWFLTESRRHRHVNPRRHQVADLMDRHRALVRDNSDATAPECPADKVVVGASWPFPNAVDSPILAHPVAACGMVVLELLWVACGPGLGGSEVSPLGSREFIETPSGILRISICHKLPVVTGLVRQRGRRFRRGFHARRGVVLRGCGGHRVG